MIGPGDDVLFSPITILVSLIGQTIDMETTKGRL